MADDCIFCKIIRKEIPSEIVFEDDEILVFKDINPQAPVHLLLIPTRHIETLNDVDQSDQALIGKLLSVAKHLAGEMGVSEGGYRVVVNCNKDAGQDVFHLHAHLLGGRKFSWPPG
ncbi:MAG: histidine triad nucleotide-binding protein [Candidatus Omnitrophica bacterium]|nr:histidine triad nucleotide-binding protein [Candidatus Omnitrophota bacterium]